MRLLCARDNSPKSAQLNQGSAPGQSIRVDTRDGVPTRIEWGGRVWRVESVEAIWCIEGRWWLDASRQGARRRCFRVGLRERNGQTLWLDIARQGQTWRAQRVAD